MFANAHRRSRPDGTGRTDYGDGAAGLRQDRARRLGDTAVAAVRRPPSASFGDHSSLEKRTEPGAITAPGHTRAPVTSSLPPPMSAPSPMTTPSSTAPAPMRAPRPITLPRTTAPPSITASSNTTQPWISAPSPTLAFAPIQLPPTTTAEGETFAPARTSASPRWPGTAGDGAIPRTRSHDPCTNAAGVPRSSQYEESTKPATYAPDSSSCGKVSRSTETGLP